MPDSALDVLKMVLLIMLYLFFARVLWAVWSEVRAPSARAGFDPAHAPVHHGPIAHANPNPDPTPAGTTRPPKGKGQLPGRLTVLEPKERRGTAFAIGEAITIGRDDDNTIRITDDAYISGHHARVSIVDGAVVVDDLGSRNGTYLNGNKLADRRFVKVGDRLQIGYTVLEAQ